MSFENDDTYAVLFLAEITVALLFAFVGWHWLALGWAGIAIADLLTYEWATNPDRYEWAGRNPHLAGTWINLIVLVYLVFGIPLIFF